MPLPREHLLDELATAYVQAVAATGGATIAVTRLDYGVDGTMKHIVRTEAGEFAESGYPVDFQLKGTTIAAIGDEHLLYDLRTRNYNLIVTRRQTAAPYYLFLVCFGGDDDVWIVQENERLIFQAVGYWWTQFGAPTANASSIRIKIPVANRLTPRAIEGILRASQSRFVL
jgi:hypothetical protein